MAEADLPLDVEALRAAVAAGRRFAFRLFWRIDRDDGHEGDRVFSQWYEAPFMVKARAILRGGASAT